MEHALLEGDIRHRLRQPRVDVADEEVDLVALDQLVGLLHRDGGVGAGRILDQQLDLAAEDAALGVDLVDRELGADQFVLAERGVGAGQRIVEADLDVVGRARGLNEGRGELATPADRGGLDDGAAADSRLAVWRFAGHFAFLPDLARHVFAPGVNTRAPYY